jgi:hypothetical protein
MISVESAAGLIASMIQGTATIGPRWDTLPDGEVLGFVTLWQRFISEGPDGATERIISSIANHPHLKAAWSELSSAIHQNRALIIRTIIADTRVA